MNKKFLKALSGINNLKGIAIFRMIIGLVIVIYGFILFYLINLDDFWTKISVPSALWALGLMFIFDGSSILREYFRNSQNSSPEIKEQKSFLIDIASFLFVIGTILFLIKFYTLENPSLYPLVIFLISIFLILIFHKNISRIKISKEGIEIDLAKRTSTIEKKIEDLTQEVDESKKQNWNFEIKEVK